MTTYNNFDSFNGWIMPGSGRQVFFEPGDCRDEPAPWHYYVDENGDAWMPCLCGGASSGPTGPAGPAGQPGRAVPKTGDSANMSLWIVLFAIGLFGLTASSTKLAVGKNTQKTPMIVIKDSENNDHFILRK